MADGGSRSADGDREDLAAFFLRLRSQETVPVRLLEAVESVPRRLFFPGIAGDLYANHSLPIPCGETAPSALTIVRAVNALRVQPDSRILEIGTGSGYATAILARLGARVTSIERYRGLREPAMERLRSLGLVNATLLLDDGSEGRRDAAPFDRVIVHATLSEIPRAFLDQLASPGILICAIGPGEGAQMLTRNHKAGSRFESEPLFPVRWQPLRPGVAERL